MADQHKSVDLGLGAFRPATRAQYLALISPAKLLLMGGAAGALKALDISTPIPTPSGFVTMAELRPGDQVFDRDGAACNVVATSRITTPNTVYRVVFDDGESVVCDGGHYWTTMTDKERASALRRTPEFRAKRRSLRPRRGTGARPWLVERNKRLAAENDVLLEPAVGEARTTLEIAESLLARGHRHNHSIDCCGPVQFSEAALPIHPYVLGVWLGDGTRTCGSITKPDQELFDNIKICGYDSTLHPWGQGSRTVLGLRSLLRRIGVLNNKHIPKPYLVASCDQRLALLAGLMDTDGTTSVGTCVFSSTNYDLALGVRTLLWSLGVKAGLGTYRARLRGRDMGDFYQVGFTPYFNPFRLSRKAALVRLASRPTTRRRYIIAVEKVPGVPVKCIKVDSRTEQFLCGRSFIPTHNSSALVIDAVMDRENPRMRSAIFRRTYPELERTVIREAEKWYPQMGGRYNSVSHKWRFPSGATVEFQSCEREGDVHKYQGSEWSMLGIDESTHFSIGQIRYLTSRVRTTDTALQARARVRLATNPGGNSHKETRDIFIGPVCTCDRCKGWVEGRSLRPLEIYSDRKWPDGKSIDMTTCFIPGKLTDHNLLGDDYKKQLRSLPTAFADALLAGCWAAWEGQYFSGWDAGRMVVPRGAAGVKSWWQFWTSTDYGFGDSGAVSYLFGRGDPSDEFPRGRIFVLDEFTARAMKAVDYALTLRAKWHESYHISAWYADPNLFGERGGEEKSLAAQMEEASRIPFEKAQQDRAAGSQLILSGLESGELVVCDNCTVALEMLPTRVHDETNPVAVKKIRGKVEDDSFDAMYYGLLSHGVISRPTLQQRIARAVNADDPNQRMFQAAAIQEEIKRDLAPRPWVRQHRGWPHRQRRSRMGGRW